MAQVLLFCEACNAHFEPIREREQCPRCEGEKLKRQMDELEATLAKMNEVALR